MTSNSDANKQTLLVILTRRAVLHSSIIDDTSELIHVSGISAVHHMHCGTVLGVCKAVFTITVQFL